MRHLTLLDTRLVLSIFGILPIGIVCLTVSCFSRAEAIPLIRDTEIETTIRIYAEPFLGAAGIEDNAFEAKIVKDSALNAFVARGQKIFLTTGLLKRSKNAEEVLGVIAHEIGHIAGGHLTRLHSALRKAGKTAIITQILGLTLGAASQNPAVGVAIASGGQHVAKRSFLKFSRGQEQSADQAAANYLDKVGISGKGLLEFLRVLSLQEFLLTSNQDPYVRTHPLTRNRINFMENHVKNSPVTQNKLPPIFVSRHLRMVAKLDAFIDPPKNTLRKYKKNDGSVPARYARTIALYRKGNLSEALSDIELLISDFPRDPYFIELKAKMLFENGRLPDAMKTYQRAVVLLPDAPLIRTNLAHVILEMNRAELNDVALKHVESALRSDRFMPKAWYLAGTVYGRKKQFGRSAWALAEYNILINRKRLARTHAMRALKLLKAGSPAWLRATDIKNEIDLTK